MKSRLFYSQVFGLLLLLLLILLAVPKYSKVIPSALKQRVETMLEEDNLKWVAVRVENRDITLSGVAPTLEEHNKALFISQTVSGIRSIRDKISPFFISPYTMNISYEQKKIVLEGYMPSKQSKKHLLEEVDRLYPNAFVDKIDVGSGEPTSWNEFVLNVLKEMKKFEISSVNIVDKELHISGRIKTGKERLTVEKNLNIFNRYGFRIHCHTVAMDAVAKVCQDRFNSLLGKNKIKFQSNKSFIGANNYKLLQELSDIALLCPHVSIKIIGHTDSLGNNTKNIELSLSRAKAVVAKLFSFGVPIQALEAKGMGENEPIADNSTKNGRAKNRRIEFKVIEREGK